MSSEFFYASAAGTSKVHIPAIGLELAVPIPFSTSDSTLTILETVNEAGFGPPLHRHRETEIFRVLEGEYLYEVDGQRFHATAGDVVRVPGGAAHGFVNLGDRPARQLVLMLPAMDAMAFFTGLGEIMAAGRPNQSVLNEYGARWGVEFLGSPIKATP
jgi:mannose-6-phosphate isomerase-like protein (cupin superfamily)